MKFLIAPDLLAYVNTLAPADANAFFSDIEYEMDEMLPFGMAVLKARDGDVIQVFDCRATEDTQRPRAMREVPRGTKDRNAE